LKKLFKQLLLCFEFLTSENFSSSIILHFPVFRAVKNQAFAPESFIDFLEPSQELATPFLEDFDWLHK